MAAEDTVFSNSDDASIALLRRLRAGAAVAFVHHADVCSAAPSDLVANLEPAPGTDLADGGYSSVWFFYCPKRFKNSRGKPSGHRHRAIAGGDNTCWHSETRPKPVKGLDGATLCNLSYGRKEEGSSRSFNRMGWCMTEYDDNHGGGSDHVLCKVYRSSSSLAKRKSKPTIERLSASKRKATADHAQSLLPTKMSHCCACVQTRFSRFSYNLAYFDFDKESRARRGPPLLTLSPSEYNLMEGSVNVVSLRILESDVGYPIRVSGTVLVRDQVDYVQVHASTCSGVAAITPKSSARREDTLALTDPCRGLAVT